jgi:hypothetical protein
MDFLISKLNEIPNSYFEFIDSVVDYAKSKPEHLTLINEYLQTHPLVSVSDVLRLISTQPDFYDDEAPINADELVC